jgi:hypothetical protein
MSWVHSLTYNTLSVKRCVGAPGWGLGRVTSASIIHTNLHSSNNKLVSAWLKHFKCMYEPQAYTDSQNSSQPEFGGSHHLPPYSILYD